MKHSIRILLVLTVLALLSTPMLAQDEEITLTVWNWSQEQEGFYDDLADAYKEEYPNVTVDWQTRALPNHNEALPLAFQSGESPDVFWYDGASTLTNLTELLGLGWVVPILNLPEDFESRWPVGSFAEGVTHIGDEYYSFNLQEGTIWGPGFMFFNEDVFVEAGLDPENPPQTRTEFVEACAAIVENTSSYCLSNPSQPANELFRLWAGLAGRAYTEVEFDYQLGRYNIDDPRNLETVEYLQSLYANEYVMPGVYDKATARAAMGSGQVAFYFGGTWIPSVLNGMGFGDMNLGVALAPTPDGGATGALASNPLGNVKVFISSQSEHQEEASAFLEWLTRPEGFFVAGYIGGGYGTLSFGDNAALISEPGLAAAAIQATSDESFRRIYPQPVLACPEAASSQAMIIAAQIRPHWEWEELQLALIEGTDFAPVAAEIAAAKNEVFLETLAEEGISPDCYAFADFDYTSSFTPDMYND